MPRSLRVAVLAVVAVAIWLAPGPPVSSSDHVPAGRNVAAAAVRKLPSRSADRRPVAEPTARYTIWDWNVAGNSMHRGSVSDGLIALAASSIISSHADLVSFNEVCAQQYEAIRRRLVDLHWPLDPGAFSAFAPTVTNGSPTVCGGRRYGLALFTRLPVGAVDRVRLPDDGTPEHRALMCATLRETPHVRFCTTHITTSNAVAPARGRPYTALQLDAVLARIEAYHAAGDTVLVTGDFNAQPDYPSLDDWYSSAVDTPGNGGNHGSYRELGDRDGALCPGYGASTSIRPPAVAPPCAGGATCTFAGGAGCERADLIFVRRDRIAGSYRSRALSIPTTCHGVPALPGIYPAGTCSDHRPVVGTVTVRTGYPAERHPGASRGEN